MSQWWWWWSFKIMEADTNWSAAYEWMSKSVTICLFVLTQYGISRQTDRQTDKRTDGQTDVQNGKTYITLCMHCSDVWYKIKAGATRSTKHTEHVVQCCVEWVWFGVEAVIRQGRSTPKWIMFCLTIVSNRRSTQCQSERSKQQHDVNTRQDKQSASDESPRHQLSLLSSFICS